MTAGPATPPRRRLPPILAQLAGYRMAWLPADASAGLAVAAVGLPSAIAYPAIAGLPPETGIYASIAAAFGYALAGPSRRLMIGPDAATMSVLAGTLATVVAALPADAASDRVAAAAAIALLVGGYCLAARMLGLGMLASFLSRPILVGFFAGVSVSILIGQIGRVTGLDIEASGLVTPLVELAREAGGVHLPSLALAIGSFALLQGLRATRIPGPVAVVVLGVLLSWLLDFQARGIATVGAIPTGLPPLALPRLGGLPLPELLLGAAAVFLVSFGAGIVTARGFGEMTRERVDPDAELGGFAAANLASGLVGGFPVTSSDSRTATNLSVGGQTQLAGLFAGLALIATLLFLNPALRILPIPALGAILVAAALSLIDVAALRRIWRISPAEFGFALIAMFGAISFGVLQGVVVAVAATLAHFIAGTMRPRDALLGRVPGREGFYKLHRTPAARPVPGMAIVLVEGGVLFFNADFVQSRLEAIAAEQAAGTRWLVLDASAVAQMDGTGAAMLDDVARDLAARGIRLGFAELHAEARGMLERAGVVERVGRGMVFEDLEDALAAFRADEAGSGARSP